MIIKLSILMVYRIDGDYLCKVGILILVNILILLLAVGGATTGNIILGIKGNGIELDGQNIWIYWLLIALLLIPIGWRFSCWVGKRLCCWLHKVGFVKPLCKIFNNLNG